MKEQIVYRFKTKVRGGDWNYVKNREGIPISITTDKGPRSVLHIFKYKYPSIAEMYTIGENLIAEKDLEATKRLADYKKRLKEEEEEKIRTAWWQN